MSRSYKKNPISKDGNSYKKDKKRFATHHVRRRMKQDPDAVGDGNNYKKHYESWDIADYISRWTKEEAIEEYEDPDSWVDHDKYPTLKSWLNYWEKCMIRK